MVGFEVLEEGEQVFANWPLKINKFDLKFTVFFCKALLFRYNGKVELKNGPKRVLLKLKYFRAYFKLETLKQLKIKLLLFVSNLRRLRLFTAHQDEYLIVKHLNGLTEHKMG